MNAFFFFYSFAKLNSKIGNLKLSLGVIAF
jgi:hypothetical protein